MKYISNYKCMIKPIPLECNRTVLNVIVMEVQYAFTDKTLKQEDT